MEKAAMSRPITDRARRMGGMFIVLCAMAGGAQAASMTFAMEHFPPFNAESKEGLTGPLPEMVWAVCKSMKIECDIKVYPWRRAYGLAEQGEVDGIFVLLKTPERENSFYFTEPVIRTSYAVFANQANKIEYRNPKDLDGYTIGVYGPSATSLAADEVARAMPSIKVELEVDNPTVLRKLLAARYGERSVAVMNLDVGKYLIKQNNLAGLRFAGEIKKIEYSIGLSRKKVSAKQAETFNSALHALIQNGTIRAIAEKYEMKPAP